MSGSIHRVPRPDFPDGLQIGLQVPTYSVHGEPLTVSSCPRGQPKGGDELYFVIDEMLVGGQLGGWRLSEAEWKKPERESSVGGGPAAGVAGPGGARFSWLWSVTLDLAERSSRKRQLPVVSHCISRFDIGASLQYDCDLLYIKQD